ncbi:unnamed protein product [Boreogadus saida]
MDATWKAVVAVALAEDQALQNKLDRFHPCSGERPPAKENDLLHNVLLQQRTSSWRTSSCSRERPPAAENVLLI